MRAARGKGRAAAQQHPDCGGRGPVASAPAGNRRSAWAATAAAEPNVTAPGTAWLIRSAASSYSVQPSTTASQPAGVWAAAAARRRRSRLVARVDRVGQARAGNRRDNADPPNSAISRR